ncbi:Bacterial Ig-like domain (group 3) [Eubacteriaceae bacterium CHKCI005]|nr:Bacterial Ig-like domain (group 3) [Eubacteriaceae bacterium CHKCI005]
MKKKLVSLSVAFVVLLNIVVSVPFLSLMAAQPVLELGAGVSQAGVKPGQTVDITVDLGNYSDDNVPGISGLQLNVPLPKEGDGLRYVEGSAKVLINADGNKSVSYNSETQQLTMIYVYNGQLLSKEEKNILTFRAEVTGQYDKDTVLELPIQSIAQDQENQTIESSVDTVKVPVLVENPTIQLNGEQNTGLSYDGPVTVTFDKGTATLSKDGEEGASLESGAVVDKPGVYTVTVTDAAGNQTKETFTIVAVSSISLTPPVKTQYIQGEEFDPTGGIVTTTYSDGTTQETDLTTGMCKVNMDQLGPQVVIVNYNGKQASFEINIEEKAVDSIEMAQLPDQLVYIQNESLDVTGGKLLVHYNNGKSEEIDLSAAKCEADTSVVSDSTVVTVTYEGKTTTFTIRVERGDVASIQMQQLPTKTEYFAGENLDVSGGKILVTYQGGSQEEMALEASMCTVDMDAVGQQKVIVTYGNQTTSFDIQVKANAVTAIKMEKNPQKTIYQLGEAFTAQGGMIQVTRQNGAVSHVDLTDAMCTVPDMTTAGEKQVVVTYEGSQTTFSITVEEKKAQRISMQNNPTKTTYVEGEELNVAGGTVRVWYSDGSTQDVSLTSEMCTGFDGNKVGTQTITVTYEGMTTSFDILVNAKSAVGLSLKKAPDKTEYIQNESLDVTGGKLVVHFDNGQNQEIDLTEDMCTDYDMSKPGKQTVTVQYMAQSTQFDIVVKERTVTSISLEKAPDKVEYLEGQALDVTGALVKVTYDNGESETLAVESSMVSGYDAAAIEKQTVTVQIGDQSASFDVTVLSKAPVEELTAAIDQIDLEKLTVSDRELVEKLLEQYDQMAPVQQEAVTNYEHLEAALKRIDGMEYSPYSQSFLDGMILIEGAPGAVPEGVSIQVETKALSEQMTDALKAKYGLTSTVAASFGVTVDNLGDGSLGKLKVSVKLDSKWGDSGQLKAVLLGEDGSIQEVKATVTDGILSFEVDGLSDFALVKEAVPVQPGDSSSSGTAQSPNTGESPWLLYVWVGILVVSAIVIVVLVKKRSSM